MRVLAAAAVLLVVQGASAFSPPWFCHGINCPVFEDLPKIKALNTTVEVRRYKAAQLWTSTVIPETSLNEAEREGFRKLFSYISGANAAGEKVDMTAPVRTLVQPAQGPFCKTNFTVSFYVPYAFEPSITSGAPMPPKPTDPTVFTAEDKEALKVAVLAFDGFASDTDAVERVARLTEILTAAKVPHDATTWFFAGYDPPFRVVGRHNEVWVRLV